METGGGSSPGQRKNPTQRGTEVAASEVEVGDEAAVGRPALASQTLAAMEMGRHRRGLGMSSSGPRVRRSGASVGAAASRSASAAKRSGRQRREDLAACRHR